MSGSNVQTVEAQVSFDFTKEFTSKWVLDLISIKKKSINSFSIAEDKLICNPIFQSSIDFETREI